MIRIIRGDTCNIQVPVTLDGAPMNITGFTAKFTARKSWQRPAVIEKEVTGHTNAAMGETLIRLSPTDTSLVPGKYVYDIELSNAQDTFTIKKGTLIIEPDISR